MRAPAGYMLSGHPTVDGPDFDAGHALSALHGFVDCASGLFDVAYYSSPDAVCALDSEPQDLGTRITGLTGHFGYNRDSFGRAQIQCRYQPLGLAAHAPTPRTMT
jgi:hypothetical protein